MQQLWVILMNCFVTTRLRWASNLEIAGKLIDLVRLTLSLLTRLQPIPCGNRWDIGDSHVGLKLVWWARRCVNLRFYQQDKNNCYLHQPVAWKSWAGLVIQKQLLVDVPLNLCFSSFLDVRGSTQLRELLPKDTNVGKETKIKKLWKTRLLHRSKKLLLKSCTEGISRTGELLEGQDLISSKKQVLGTI